MKSPVDNHPDGYDTRLEASDWRYGASLVGLIQYFKFLERVTGESHYSEEEEAIAYRGSDITEERYLEFVEDFFEEDMHHRQVEKWLAKDEFTADDVGRVNERLLGNTVMKKVFSKYKFDGENKGGVLERIQENRKSLVKETFRNKKNLYANYSNANLLLQSEKQPHCRLVGYNVDEGRKSKSLAYHFVAPNFVNEDCIEFDFIPFAFTNTREAFFINNNFSVSQMMQTYYKLCGVIKAELEEEKGNAKAALFGAIMESADFIDYDVEVIVKNRENEFYETLLIKREAIKVLRGIKNRRALSFAYKRGENYYVNIQNEVVDHVLNNILLDELIEMFLKSGGGNWGFIISQFIDINLMMKGGGRMTNEMKSAFACAKEVVKSIQKNKVDSYRQKLISSIVFHDYDRACDILLQLSNYSGVSFGFAYPLFEDFEGNKELAYTFINALELREHKE